MIVENYGVYLTPHFEKYQVQDQETSDVMHATWNFGNKLKAQGYGVAYMHGSIALYENMQIVAGEMPIKTVEDFTKVVSEHKKDFVYFLFQKSPKTLRFAAVRTAEIAANRARNGPQPKKKKKRLDKLASDM